MLDSSFDEFVNAQLSALYRYALVLTGDGRSAEDLVQETLVRVAGGWRRIRDRENPSGYATTVMFRTHVSLWRVHRRAPRTAPLTVDPMAEGDGFAAVEARMTLEKALRRLPRLQHAVLVATYLRDHTDDEIAEMIGRSPSTVRSLRHRGLKTLRGVLETGPSSGTGTVTIDRAEEVPDAQPGIGAP